MDCLTGWCHQHDEKTFEARPARTFELASICPQDTTEIVRFLVIGTDRPIFAGRDGVKRYALAEVERERRTGSPWYGNWPKALLETDYPKWRAGLRPDRAP